MHSIYRLFYTLKPFIPRGLQIALRREIARQKRGKYRHIWPIDPATSLPPKNWSGWPEGKKFALLLCHDIESQKGHDSCMQLARLESALGFRSFFNFVPEKYNNSTLLREDIRSLGCDIGVHGLKHDGKLFFSRQIFDQRARKINAYLKSWSSQGFTAPSMLCNHEWLQSLDIAYSTTTFDTDPFEPQQQPARTIFPYWVQRNGCHARGYLELPYTLPQDHLLYVILKEKHNGIWKRKLDWVAEKGGMALLNTHVDYICFGGKPGAEEYPVAYYRDFLMYIRKKYAGRYWQPLPREVALFWRKNEEESDDILNQMTVECLWN